MCLAMIMNDLLGKATRKDLVSLAYTHRMKTKDISNYTYSNIFTAKIGEGKKQPPYSLLLENCNKIPKREIMKWW